MTDLPVLEWEEPSGREPHTANLGVVALYAWPAEWQVDWRDDFASGSADSLDEAKAQARAFAKTLLRQVLAQLDRGHDPVTGMVVQLPDDAEVQHA